MPNKPVKVKAIVKESCLSIFQSIIKYVFCSFTLEKNDKNTGNITELWLAINECFRVLFSKEFKTT